MPLGDLPIPETKSLGELPVPDTGLGGVPAQQRDAEAFQATSGEVGKGLRSSVNSLGATLHAFMGGGAEAMGLTQFAAERFKEAEDYVKFADAVGPVVRDYRAVKDFNDAAMLAAGLAGQAVGSSLPAAVLGPAGAARFGLRGAVAGAAAGSFVPETGEALLTTKDEKASPQKKLAAAVGKGAVNAALDTASLAVPASAVARGLKGVAPKVLPTIGKSIAAEGVTEGIQEVVGQKAHEIVNPARDASGDVPATINAALGGAVGGAVLGGGAGIASKAGQSLAKFRAENSAKLPEGAKVPADRTQTLDEAKSALSQRDKVPPLDPELDKVPDDPEHISDALDAHDAEVDKAMKREWDAGAKDKYPQFDGWEKDATKREGLHDALSKLHGEEVDKPLWRKAAESVGKFVDGLRPPEGEAKKSERRTALDVAVFDNMLRHLPEHVRDSLTPAQRIDLADAVKKYAMHTAGVKEEQPGPGAPEQRSERNSVSELAATGEQGKSYTQEGPRPTQRVVPHALMDIFGDQLHPLVASTQDILGKGGVKLESPITKPELQRGERRRGERLGRMEDIVLAHIKPEIDADPKVRGYVVKEMTARLRRAAQDGVQDWGKFNQELDYVFGKDAQYVLEEFDKAAQDVTRAYEDMGDAEPRTDESTADKLKRNEQFRVTEEDEALGGAPTTEPEPNPTGEQPLSRQEQAHPYRDKRLGVAMDLQSVRHTLDGMRAEPGFDPRDVRLRIEPEVKDNQMTGKFVIHAEDAEAKVGFTKEELERIQEKHGQAGHENSVVSVVRKDPDDPARNKTVAISIPNLVAETIRSTNRKSSGPAFVHDMVMEGLSRLVSDPDFVRFAPSSAKEAWNFPDDMLVAKVKGEEYTWGQVRKEADVARQNEKDYYSTVVKELNARLEEAKNDGEIKPADDRGRFPNRMSEYADLRARVERGSKGAKEAYNSFVRKYARNQEEAKSGYFSDETKREGTIDTEELRQAAEELANKTPREPTLDSTRPLRDNLNMEAVREARAVERTNRESAPVGDVKGHIAESVVAKTTQFGVEERAKAAYEKDNPGKAWERADVKDRVRYMRISGSKLSEMRIGTERITAEQAKAVRAEVERLLGKDAAVKLIDGMTEAGRFANIDGVETLHISLSAMDPLGVGRHESLHALLARMAKERPDVANVLSNAARSPNVVAQLRRLLAGEPAALRQLVDHEERAAYMYEFWAAGKLQVGPKAEGLFGKVKEYLAKAAHLVFGLGEDPAMQAKAEELLRAFHSGELADKSASGRVLSRLLPRDQLENTWLGRLGDWSNRVWSTADGYVRDQKIPAMTDVADKMFNPAEGKPGLVQARHIARNQFMNRYAQATKGMDEATQASTLAALQSGAGSSTAPARAIRGILDDLFTYMQARGVKVVEWNEEAHQYDEHTLQRLPDFFPRAYDKDVIAAKWDEFVALLARHGVPEPEAVAQQLVHPTKAAPDESDHTSGLTYYAPNTMARKLKIPDAELAPFMKKDLGSIMYDYINYTTRRGEYASRFGNQGQEIAKAEKLAVKQGATPEQMKSFGKYVQAMEGSLGNKIDPKLRKFMGAVLTYQNFRLLPLSLFSSLIDPLGIGVRGGTTAEAFTAFTRGIRDLVSTKEDEARHLARAIGAINEATEEHMVSDMYGANYGANWQKWLNNKLFKLNGMESWNNSMRTAAAAAAQTFIVRHATEPGKHSERYLRELGLSADDVRAEGGQLELTPAVVDALNKWVDGAVLRPHAGIRPIWQSDPHFMLVSHLKQFTYSFQKTINERVAHEAMNGNYTPLLVLSAYVPGIIASDVLRAALTPGGMDDSRMRAWGLKDWLLHGVNRAGLSGPGQYALDSYSDLHRSSGPVSGAVNAITDVGGPTTQQIRDLLRAAVGSGDMARQGLRALPILPAMGV